MEKTAFKERPYFVEAYQVKYRTYQIEILSTTNQMNILAGIIYNNNHLTSGKNWRRKNIARKNAKFNVPHYTGNFTEINTLG